MPWPFSRRDPAARDRDPAEVDERRGGARDPAAELRARTRRRLIGAAALLVGAVIVLPLLLDSAPRQAPESLSITVAGQAPVVAQPGQPPVIDEKIAEPAPARTQPDPAVAPPATARADKAAPAAPAPSSQADLPSEAASPSQPAEAARSAEPAEVARPAPPSAKGAAADKVLLQVAALSTPEAADELVARLSLDGFKAYAEPVPTVSGTLHRVRVGPYGSREQAQRAANRLKAAGYRATVVGG